ncbi:MAG: hypothetical protein ACFFDW_16230 [Candidatus Thorarchaeota archaeon]
MVYKKEQSRVIPQESTVRFTIKKIITYALILFLLSFIIYALLFHSVDRLRHMIVPTIFLPTPEEYAEMWYRYGVNCNLLTLAGEPINFFVRYGQWLGLCPNNKGIYCGLFQGYLGISWFNLYDHDYTPTNTANILSQYWYRTIFFVLVTLLIGILVATSILTRYFRKKGYIRILDKHRVRYYTMSLFLLIIVVVVNNRSFCNRFFPDHRFVFLRYNLFSEQWWSDYRFYAFFIVTTIMSVIWMVIFLTRQIITMQQRTEFDKNYLSREELTLDVRQMSYATLWFLTLRLCIHQYSSYSYIVFNGLAMFEMFSGFYGPSNLFFAYFRDYPLMMSIVLFYAAFFLTLKFVFEVLDFNFQKKMKQKMLFSI